MRQPKKEPTGGYLMKLGLGLALAGLLFVQADEVVFRSLVIGGIALTIIGAIYKFKGL